MNTINDPISERALAMLIQCRVASGQPLFAAVSDVLGIERFDAMRKSLKAAIEAGQ